MAVEIDTDVLSTYLHKWGAENLSLSDYTDADEDGMCSVTPPAPEVSLDDILDGDMLESFTEAALAAAEDTLATQVDDVWDDVVGEIYDEIADAASFARDPYAYYGMRQSDFL